MFDLNQLMSKAREMQDKMKTMQDDLGRKQVTAEAAGGMVTATVNGKLQLVKIRIDQAKVNLNDLELLEDVIVAAVNAAQERAGETVKQEMAKLSADMGIPPGMLPQ